MSPIPPLTLRGVDNFNLGTHGSPCAAGRCTMPERERLVRIGRGRPPGGLLGAQAFACGYTACGTPALPDGCRTCRLFTVGQAAQPLRPQGDSAPCASPSRIAPPFDPK